MATMNAQQSTRSPLWEVNSRTIVYAAIGAALYGVPARSLQIPIPGTGTVSIRPAFALVPFFGYAFGPIVGFFTGLRRQRDRRPVLRLGPPDLAGTGASRTGSSA